MKADTAITVVDEKRLQKQVEIIDKARTNLNDSALDIGRALNEIRAIVGEKEFVPYIERECRFSKSSAYGYLNVYKEFASFQRLEWIDPESLYKLSRSEPAAAEAKKLATKGQRISGSDAKAILKKFKAVAKRKATATASVQAAPVPADPDQPKPNAPEPGGYEPDEAKRPLAKLETTLSKAARDWGDVHQILGPSAGLKAVFDGIDQATRALAQFRREFKKAAK